MNFIDKVAPIKERRVKQKSQEWFDGQIANEFKNLINYLINVINYFKNLSNQNYTLTKILMMRQDTNYRK